MYIFINLDYKQDLQSCNNNNTKNLIFVWFLCKYNEENLAVQVLIAHNYCKCVRKRKNKLERTREETNRDRQTDRKREKGERVKLK